MSRVVIAVVSLLSTAATAADIIQPGVQPKMAAGAGQTVTRGSGAIYYNPANLIYSKFVEPYLDVAYAQVNYSYQHTDTETFDPVEVSKNTPLVTAGLGVRFIPSFALGLAFVPTGFGSAVELENVPLELQPKAAPGTFVPTNVSAKDSGFRLALGAAYRFAHPFTAGLGVLMTREHYELQAHDPNSDALLVDTIYGGDFLQFIVGGRSELLDRMLVIALSYKTSVTKTYKGDGCYGCEQDPSATEIVFEPYEGVGYEPAEIGFGLEGRVSMFAAFLDVVYEQWSAGRTVAREGRTDDPFETDLVDTVNIVAGAKYWVAGKHMLTIAGGLYPANIGDGTDDTQRSALTQTGDEVSDDGSIAGVRFGDVNAIPLTAFSGGYRMKLTGHGYLKFGVQYASGTRSVPEGFDGQGDYAIDLLMFAGGLAFGF